MNAALLFFSERCRHTESQCWKDPTRWPSGHQEATVAWVTVSVPLPSIFCIMWDGWHWHHRFCLLCLFLDVPRAAALSAALDVLTGSKGRTGPSLVIHITWFVVNFWMGKYFNFSATLWFLWDSGISIKKIFCFVFCFMIPCQTKIYVFEFYKVNC